MDGWVDGWTIYAFYLFFISKMSEGGFCAFLSTLQQGNSSKEACDESATYANQMASSVYMNV